MRLCWRWRRPFRTGRAAPGWVTCSSGSWTSGGSGAWPAARSWSCCPTAGSVVTCRCSATRWRDCTDSLIGWSGPTPARAVPDMRRSPRVWPRPFRTLTSSCQVTVSPRSSGSPQSSPAVSNGRSAMRDLLPELTRWWEGGTRFALATVVGVRGSAPRQPGASMAVSADGEAIGSVSGGCVEGAVYELASEVLESGEPVLQTYGISDDEAFAVGLTCGGILDILVRPIDTTTTPTFTAASVSISAQEPVAVATVIDGDARVAAQVVVWRDRIEGTLGAEGLDVAVVRDARGMLAQGQTGVRHYGPQGDRRQDEVPVFIESFAPPPRMLVFGAIDFAAAG